MRINVYSQELTGEIKLVAKESNTGTTYHAVQMILHLPPSSPQDDDRSAVTFWLPKSSSRRNALAKTFRDMARLVEAAPPETGLD